MARDKKREPDSGKPMPVKSGADRHLTEGCPVSIALFVAFVKFTTKMNTDLVGPGTSLAAAVTRFPAALSFTLPASR